MEELEAEEDEECLETARGPKQRGPKAPADGALAREVAKLRRENERLRTRLDQAETIIEVKELSTLLGLDPEKNESNGKR